MQKDLHHAGTYALCRMAGMKSEFAEIVAYCAEQVDDAIYGHALVFENGGSFKQTQTAYHRMNPDNLDINRAYDVLMAFHFIPDAKSFKNEKGLVTDPGSKVLSGLLDNIVEHGDSDLGLYRLGIGLHCFEDVYAHQDFIGYYSGYNDVDLVSGEVESIKIKLFKDRAIIGHGPVGHNPDIPFREWRYKREDDGEEINVDNVERFLSGLEYVYEFIKRFLNENEKYRIEGVESIDFGMKRGLIEELLRREGDVDERHENWLEAIANNIFAFAEHDETDEKLDYGDREWFYEAVEVVDEEPSDLIQVVSRFLRDNIVNHSLYRKKDGFSKSDWVKYMLAAQEHKYVVNRMIVEKSI